MYHEGLCIPESHRRERHGDGYIIPNCKDFVGVKGVLSLANLKEGQISDREKKNDAVTFMIAIACYGNICKSISDCHRNTRSDAI